MIKWWEDLKCIYNDNIICKNNCIDCNTCTFIRQSSQQDFKKIEGEQIKMEIPNEKNKN